VAAETGPPLATTSAGDPAGVAASAASPSSRFIAKLTKPIGVVLPCPSSPKLRKKMLPEDFIPRFLSKKILSPGGVDELSSCHQSQIINLPLRFVDSCSSLMGTKTNLTVRRSSRRKLLGIMQKSSNSLEP
jgi:hypothetical protein